MSEFVRALPDPFHWQDQNAAEIKLLQDQLQDMQRQMVLLLQCNALLMDERNRVVLAK